MGITWNYAAAAWEPSGQRRRIVATLGLLSTSVTAVGLAVALQHGGPPALGGVGADPWFGKWASTGPATPSASSAAPLPDLASVEQVADAPPAWAAGADGRGVDVAVLDSGVTPVPGLDAPNKVVYGPDLSFDSQNAATANVDGYGHGTAMASIIAANNGPGGFQGVAPNARVVSVKVGASNGAVDVSQIVAGIDWVVAHAHDPGFNIRVLNLSLGTDSTQAYVIDPLAHAAEVAWRNGIVVVAAVGNAGSSTRLVADPAIDPAVIAVGSDDPVGTVTTSDDVVSPFSTRGNSDRHADVIAPGTYVLGLRDPGSTLDQAFPGARVGDSFFRGSGTSQAAAMVAGAAADVLSAHPSYTPDRVKRSLMKTAVDIGAPNQLQGAGLIDVAAAVNVSVSKDYAQLYLPACGLGSLEAARGSSHVTIGTTALTGEQDIFGDPWNAPSMALAEERGLAWSGGTYNGATWTGNTWTSASLTGITWSGITWSGITWSGITWSGVTWSGITWSGITWSGITWSGDSWDNGSGS
jgi:serine protease AprX